MHLAINATEIGRQRGGNESYLVGLLDGLRSLPYSSDRYTVLASQEGMEALRAEAWPACFQVVNTGPWRRWPSYLWQQTRALQRVRADWYLANFLLPPVVPCRAVVVVHDLSFRAHPGFFPSSIALYMRVLVGWAVRRAERIVVDSDFTRREMQRFYPSALDRTAMIHIAIGREFVPEGDPAADDAVLREYGVEPPFILSVGNIHPRKNLALLLDAFERLRETRAQTPRLVWVGVERWGSTQLQERARAAGVVLTGRVAAGHLPAFYRRASILAYPSLYEGFGLPPLEAMACGTPVVTSNTTSLPEVTGDAALLANPLDTTAWVRQMEKALFDGALRAEMRARGLRQAAQYDWTRAAGQLLTALAATA